MAKTRSITMYIPQGSTYLHTFYYQNSDSTPVDLTGFIGRMHVRESIDATTTLYDSTVTGDITIDGPAGEVILEIAAAETATWTFTTAYFDLEIEDVSGKVTRLVQGKIKVDPEVTR